MILSDLCVIYYLLILFFFSWEFKQKRKNQSWHVQSGVARIFGGTSVFCSLGHFGTVATKPAIPSPVSLD